MRAVRPWAAGILLALLALLADGRAHAGPYAIRVMGATSLTALLSTEAAHYSRGHPGITVHVTGGGSVAGLYAVALGHVDLGAADLLPAWTRIPAADLETVRLGCLAVALVVHPGVGVDRVSAASARRLFAGRIASWQELGGADANVVVVIRAPGSGARAVIGRTLMAGEAYARSAVVQLSNGAVYRTVATTPGAIGFVEAGFVRPGVRPLGLDGRRYLGRDWPYQAPVGLYWRRGAAWPVADFARYAARSPLRGRYGIRACPGGSGTGVVHGPESGAGSGVGSHGRRRVGGDAGRLGRLERI